MGKTVMKKVAMKKVAMKTVAMKKVAMKKVAMKKVAMKKAMKSIIAKGKRAKSSVFRGTKAKTSGGLTKDKRTLNKAGKVVSKAASAAAKKKFAKSPLAAWIKAVQTARKELGIKGFCAVGGKSAEGKAVYAKAKSLFKA